jgi:proteasome lid subunit RPN8/RPN11
MVSVEEQISRIIGHFPGTHEIQPRLLDIPLYPKMSIQVDLRKYPRRPKVILPKDISRLFDDIDAFISFLKEWDPNYPPYMDYIVGYIKWTIDAMAGLKARITDKLADQLCEFARDQAPQEMFCVLRISNGLIFEYVLAPGMEASEVAAIFYPHKIGRDTTIIGSCHSHPTPNNNPSPADLETFRQKPVNLIIGAPYKLSNIAVYNAVGKKIDLELIDA